jgi:ribosome-binding factor A
MASERRIEQINNLLKDELSIAIKREIEIPEDTLITITRVTTSIDVHYSTVYVSILGGNPESTLEVLKKNVYHIQQILNRRVRMRPVPKIRFAIDAEEENREKVERALADLKRKGEL